MKRMLCFAVIAGSLFFPTGNYAAADSSAGQRSLYANVESTVIEGRAKFVEHQNVVVFVICESGHCPQPQYYWSFMIEDIHSGITYEIENPIAVGTRTPPTKVTIAGVVIRPGSTVSLDADVERLTHSYGVIRKVNSASIIMD